MRSFVALGLLALLAPVATQPSLAQRRMETLGRGLVAVRGSAESVFVSWRVLGLDAPDTAFNLYRSTDGAPPVRLNSAPLLLSNFSDSAAPVGSTHAYSVRPVIAGVEQDPAGDFTLAAAAPIEPALRIPLRPMPGHRVHFVWVGDLDGDGEYDFVLDRQPRRAEDTQRLEACSRHGRHLWTVDLGPGSLNRNNIEPGPSAIDVGHWDGVTVYDFDGDGRAEIALRAADGVVLGDGSTVSGLGANRQAILILDGLTGSERARAPVPDDYLSDGPLAAHLGVAYLDGREPSLVGKFKNRVGRGAFNCLVAAWRFDGAHLENLWTWRRPPRPTQEDAHQIRLFDIDGDGRDEIVDGGYVLNPDGTLRHHIGAPDLAVIHGDRFHLGDFDPARPGIEGFYVQQNHPEGLRYLLYDAASGAPLHVHRGEGVVDVGRGVVADIDPRFPGAEYWAFNGIHRVDTGEIVSPKHPWPNFRVWWDGDLLAETLNDGRVEKWDPLAERPRRLLTLGAEPPRGLGGRGSHRGAPLFYGDILGDWREEIIVANRDHTELIIATTPIPTEHRLYTLAHNPAYRLSMTVKGYLQSHYPDYFLGHDMAPPPPPDIRHTR